MDSDPHVGLARIVDPAPRTSAELVCALTELARLANEWSDVVRGLPGGPGFPDPEARSVAATCGDVRLWSVYVPNGREPGHDHYHYKLQWLAVLRDVVAAPDGTIWVLTSNSLGSDVIISYPLGG